VELSGVNAFFLFGFNKIASKTLTSSNSFLANLNFFGDQPALDNTIVPAVSIGKYTSYP